MSFLNRFLNNQKTDKGDERLFGFENFGNTCYSNSVMQALYFCKPFRHCAMYYQWPESAIHLICQENKIQLKQQNGDLENPWQGSEEQSLGQLWKLEQEDTLLQAVQSLFLQISTQKKKSGVLAPKQFIIKLKMENELFNSTWQQDAHEMFNFMINNLQETLLAQMKTVQEQVDMHFKSKTKTKRTWIHSLFEGQLTNETRCLNCESVTNRDESFLDISVDIDQDCSLSSCLRSFSNSEVLRDKNKFFCDTCNSLQEAEKRMKIKKLPNVLAIHLKRFKYQEDLDQFSKLSYRVAFQDELRLFNTADGAENADRLYELCAIIVHIGGGPNSGHYIALAKTGNQWYMFDDDVVTQIDSQSLPQYFGQSTIGTGYLLIYNAVDFDHLQLVKTLVPDDWSPPTNPPSPTKDKSVLSEQLAFVQPSLEDEESFGTQGTPPNTKKKGLLSLNQDKRPSLPQLTVHVPEPKLNGPKSAGLNEEKKDGGWGWFKKDSKKSLRE